ncbi:MAG: cobyrinate a,c-diamide synthase [Eubacteriales bacterium]|nr:cobyrinate a,c-diamide synthase [Eubacteriales bacterium]
MMTGNENRGCFPRIMLAAGASGSGKTLLTCGLLQALKNRKMKVASYKCGPDYIDPMFHEKVLKTKSRNLDTFFTDRETTRYLFARNAEDVEISVMEGVMGFYDGLGGVTDKASACDLAKVTDTPVVLIVNTKGMSLSVLAYIKGFLEYRKDSGIKGVILNQTSAMLYPELKTLIEKELDIHVYGYVPKVTDCVIESRHLGLVMPEEVQEFSQKLQKLADILEESLDIDGLLALAGNAPDMYVQTPDKLKAVLESSAACKIKAAAPKIAVARDEAFCFIYEDNLQLLRQMGARLIEFSPIHDKRLPEGIQGLLLYGGYPELHAEKLSENTSMLEDIKQKICAGIPCMAECGGFMYLHNTMEDMEKREWKMAGVIDGRAYRTDKLGRFGYIELELSDQEDASEKAKLRGHEFHYFDSTDCGDAYTARKPLRKRSWKCIHRTENLMAGFPHLYYYANPETALDFCMKCEGYR